MNPYKKIALVIIFMALGLALAPFTSIPIGIAKINPTQHFINVLLAILAGPWASVLSATGLAIIRNSLGLGTILAFPGGMIGAFIAGVLYKITGKFISASMGEVIGSGILAPLISSILIAPFIMGKHIGIVALIPSFLLSSLSGSILAYITIISLKKANVLPERSMPLHK
ncbi:energy coupling factor transporter S component ThiW [Spirochaeta cellobiosiphila]|uniref:energy coupling factor transporter S component ThiW n=1 Tax=Spirochaeta cellobiosiphila TaxID=504483 RepID=UPI00048AD4E3|nr:energy coupling factor transporter S component ThiW [Spirochaeta cellobiosiphila]